MTMRLALRGDGIRLSALDRIAAGFTVRPSSLLRRYPPPRLYLGKQEPPSAETLMLRLRRCRRDFDIEEIAQRSGVPRSTLYRILDKPTDVHIRRIAQLARGLGREPSWFIVASRR